MQIFLHTHFLLHSFSISSPLLDRLTYNSSMNFFLTGILGCHTIEDEINTCRVLDKIIEHNKDLEIIHPDIRFINARQKKHGIVKLKRITNTTEQLRSTRKRPLPEEDDKSTSNKKEKQKLKCAMEHRRN